MFKLKLTNASSQGKKKRKEEDHVQTQNYNLLQIQTAEVVFQPA